MICVMYVDDKILAGPGAKALEEVITSLGITEDYQRHTFELGDEGEICDLWVLE